MHSIQIINHYCLRYSTVLLKCKVDIAPYYLLHIQFNFNAFVYVLFSTLTYVLYSVMISQDNLILDENNNNA